MTAQKFFYPLTIQETHLDTFGHVNNAVYLILFEQARWDFINQNGYGIDKITATGLGPVILDIKIKYLKELKAGEKVIIESQTISYRKKISKFRQVMRRGGEICCTAEFTMGLFCLKERKLVLPTPAWLAAIGFDKTTCTDDTCA
jgi:thioesterase-3